MQLPSSLPASNASEVAKRRSRGLWLLLILAAADAFIPFAPFMPEAGLDPSWIYAMNQAVSQGLSFGRDVVFTFGPYASIFTKTYDPATAVRMIAGSAYLAAVYIGCVHFASRNAYTRTGAALGLIVTLLLSGSDSLLLCLPLLVGVATFTLAREPGSSRWRFILIAIAFSALGLLPLVKGSLLPLCGLVVMLCCTYMLSRRQVLLAVLCAVSPIVTMLLLWLCAGERLSALMDYLASMKLMVSGFSEAMAVSGPVRELLLFIVPSLLMLAALVAQRTLARPDKLFLLALYVAFLFISFKAGFVRQDIHVRIALCNLLVCLALLFLVVPPGQFSSRKLLVALLASTALSGGYLTDRALRDPKPAHAGATSNPLTPRVLAYDTRPWLVQFETTKKRLSLPCAAMEIQGSVDIYSFEQTCFLARGLSWNPRPVLQSYAAYMPDLAQRNEAHLRGAGAPERLVFKLQTIDNRLPAMDDGLSLPAMLDNYALARADGSWMLLTKKQETRLSSRYEQLGSLTASLGQEVKVPTSLPLYAEISVRPTLLGKLVALIYKPPTLTLRVTLANGETISRRVNSNMMITGFFLSPWLETNDDVAMLFEGKAEPSQRQAVKSARIDSSSSLPMWQTEYAVSFKRYLY